MTTIILYKNCILQKDYKEVLHPSILDRYLETLEKETAISNGNFFMRFNDRINLPISKSVYNYMKVINDDFMFYAFIDNMEIQNKTIDISYSLDVWNTFFNKCTIRNGLLTRTLWYNKNNERYLPVALEGNGELSFNIPSEYFGIYPATAIYTIQYYKLAQAGETPKRDIANIVLNSGNAVLPISSNLENLKDIILNQATADQFVIDEDNYYYDIIDIHIVPVVWLNNFFNVVEIANTCRLANKDGTLLNKYYELAFGEYNLFDKTIKYNDIIDYSNKYVGTLDKLIELNTNGIDNTYRISMIYTGTLFHFFISVNNQRVEITDSLRLNIPYTSVTGETNALRELSAEYSYQQGKVQQYSGLYNLSFGVVSGIIGTALGNIGAIASPMNSLASNVGNIVLGNTKSEQAFAEKYSTLSPSSDTKSLALFNYKYLEMPVSISISNLTEVKSALAENGFKVKYLIQGLPSVDENTIQYTNKYNVVKYSSLTMIGECPHVYIESLKRILESGTRIWYELPEPITINE